MPNLAVFSTSVEVFLSRKKSRTAFRGLLHVRGGVSGTESHLSSSFPSSPRPWRCFRRRTHQHRPDRVFSTSVEVFLARWMRPGTSLCLLHVRGGVSGDAGIEHYTSESSPRPWRCFQILEGKLREQGVFSTSVEVFLSTFT